MTRITTYGLPGVTRQFEKKRNYPDSIIVNAVCQVMNTTIQEVRQQSGIRKREYVQVRFMMMYLLRNFASSHPSYVDIGKFVNATKESPGRKRRFDHTSVIHGVKTFLDHVEREPDLADQLDRVFALLNQTESTTIGKNSPQSILQWLRTMDQQPIASGKTCLHCYCIYVYPS